LLHIESKSSLHMKRRAVDLVVISDVHLGTYGSKAKELNQYLKSIKPKTLVLNGDIIDIWQFRKRYFPKSHMKVIKQIMHLASKGTKVKYLTGNHDEMLRKFTDTQLGNFELLDKLVLDLDGQKAWIFHGDIFDASIQNAKWLAKLGGWGYDLLIMTNTLYNFFLLKMGKERYSFSKKIKNSVKKAVSYINSFEEVAAELAIDKGYDFVICGHIHQPQMRLIESSKGETLYLNSGDWVENLTALEYMNGQWDLYQHTNHSSNEIGQEEEEFLELSLDELIRKVTLS
jgi:UDP-2,3-diacylglucosamine pyrophosphatase LpxH